MKSTQSLLAERRAFVIEQSRASDPTEHAMLQFEIDEIDREIARRAAGVLQPPVRTDTARPS